MRDCNKTSRDAYNTGGLNLNMFDGLFFMPTPGRTDMNKVKD